MSTVTFDESVYKVVKHKWNRSSWYTDILFIQTIVNDYTVLNMWAHQLICVIHCAFKMCFLTIIFVNEWLKITYKMFMWKK